jgi:hypothetical protein
MSKLISQADPMPNKMQNSQANKKPVNLHHARQNSKTIVTTVSKTEQTENPGQPCRHSSSFILTTRTTGARI